MKDLNASCNIVRDGHRSIGKTTMPYYEGRFQNVDSVTGRDSAEKTVTQSDVTVTVPILLLLRSAGSVFSFTHMP